MKRTRKPRAGKRPPAPEAVQIEPAPYDPYRDPEYLAFVAQIRAAPDDRTVCLVAADWIEEKGNDPARAELVREMTHGRITDKRTPISLSRCANAWKKGYDDSRPTASGFKAIDENRFVNVVGKHFPRWFEDVRDAIKRAAALGELAELTEAEQDFFLVDGFLKRAKTQVGFLLRYFDDIYPYHPISSYEVTDWDWRGPDGNPIIRPDSDTATAFHFWIAGKKVTIGHDELSSEIYSDRVSHTVRIDWRGERDLAERLFPKRWPGVKFTVPNM